MEFACRSTPFAIIQGPSGWGKSLLLEEAAGEARSKGADDVRLVSGQQPEKCASQIASAEVLIVDDVEMSGAPAKVRLRCSAALERRMRGGRPILCAAQCKGFNILSLLAFPRSWRRAELTEPTAREKEEILRSMCNSLGLNLTQEVVSLIGKLVRGDGRALSGALKRIRVAGRDRGRELSLIRAAGVLTPGLNLRADFDLRDIVVDCVSLSTPVRCREHDPAGVEQLSVLLMRDEAGLSESLVSDYLGIRPGRTYRTLKDARARLLSADKPFANRLERSTAMISQRLRDV
jgi:chromosomal replication initiation ATPase DnaA